MIRRYAGIVAITLAGLAIRLVGISRWPLWSDEALTLVIAQWPLKTLFLAPIDPSPGLYYALHKALLGPMAGVAAARSISVAAGVLLIPASYFLARQARIPALLAAALIALSFPLIDYSQEARAYSLLVLLVILSAGFFLWWARTARFPLLIASLGFGALAIYTHFTAWFWVGPLVLATILFGGRRTVTPLLLLAIVAVPELSRLAHYDQRGFTWLAQASPLEAADTLIRALLPFRPSVAWALPVLLVLAWRIWVHRSGLRTWMNANTAAAAVLLILIAIPLEVWLFGFVVKPIFLTRTILLAVPGYLLAFALLLSFEHALVSFAVVAVYAASLLVTGTMRPKEDWRTIAQRVHGNTVLMCQLWQVPAMEHALGDARETTSIVVRDGRKLLELNGEPWAIRYFRTVTNEQEKRQALSAGQRLSGSLFPVWAIRSGSAESLPREPTTLGAAIQICDSTPKAAPRYAAD